MGNPKCNLTPEEQREALSHFDGYLTSQEEELARDYFQQYLFFDTWGMRNYRNYYCPECGGFEVYRGRGNEYRYGYMEDPFRYHHGDLTNCPQCGREATLVCLGRVRTMKSLHEWKKLCFLRAIDGRLFIEAGYSEISYSHEDLRPLPEFYPTAWYVVEPGKRQMWRRVSEYVCDGLGGGYVRGEWRASKTFAEPFAKTHYEGMQLKTGELCIIGAEAIGETTMKYCQAAEFFWDEFSADILMQDGNLCPELRGLVAYLGEYSRRPQLEMLQKLGHRDVITALLNGESLTAVVNWRAKKPAEFFRLSKTDYRVWCEHGGKLRALTEYRMDTRGMSFELYMQRRAFFKERFWQVCDWCEKLGIEFAAAERYIQQQAPIGTDGYATAGFWMDYLDMAKKLERDQRFRRNVFPDELMQEHDAALRLLAKIQSEEKKKTYGKRFRELRRRFSYSDGELTIAVPVSASEIELEGKQLQHCVAGYARRHIEGKTTILFLRKNEERDTPYVTIEINEETLGIKQMHGFRNDIDDPEGPQQRHRDFIEEWILWVKQGSRRSRNGKPIRTKKNNKKEKVA